MLYCNSSHLILITRYKGSWYNLPARSNLWCIQHWHNGPLARFQWLLFSRRMWFHFLPSTSELYLRASPFLRGTPIWQSRCHTCYCGPLGSPRPTPHSARCFGRNDQGPRDPRLSCPSQFLQPSRSGPCRPSQSSFHGCCFQTSRPQPWPNYRRCIAGLGWWSIPPYLSTCTEYWPSQVLGCRWCVFPCC